MKLDNLSSRARETAEKIAKAKGVKPIEVLRHIESIISRRKVSKHSRLFC